MYRNEVIIMEDIKLYDILPKNIPTVFNLPMTASEYLNLPNFKD